MILACRDINKATEAVNDIKETTSRYLKIIFYLKNEFEIYFLKKYFLLN